MKKPAKIITYKSFSFRNKLPYRFLTDNKILGVYKQPSSDIIQFQIYLRTMFKLIVVPVVVLFACLTQGQAKVASAQINGIE